MPLSDYRIMIVDDQEMVRKLLRRFITNNGCENVAEAANGLDAMRVLLEDPPDLIICDINMSPGDGFSFIAEMRKRGGDIAGIPVIILTSHADEAFVQKAREMKVDGYLLKPIAAEKLVSAVAKILARRWEI